MFTIICSQKGCGEVVYEDEEINPCKHIDQQGLLELVEYLKRFE